MSDTLGAPIREQALQLVQSLPADASWDDLMYRIYVRQAIEAGIQDADSERTTETADVRKEFGLAP
jgi:hypothetical protein